MANYYFMECCLEHQKTRIIKECNLMGCEGKHHFQEHFIEKKDDRKKLAHFYAEENEVSDSDSDLDFLSSFIDNQEKGNELSFY